MGAFSWLSRLRRKPGSTMTTLNIGIPAVATEPRETHSPSSQAHWTAATENPFRVNLLDCSAFAESMVSLTSSADIATRFSQLRGAQGEHCRGKDPDNAVTTDCHLEYPSARHDDGPIFQAQQMEDKWDVFLFDGHLYFARSWTGELVYKASVRFEDSKAVVVEIRRRGEARTEEDSVAVVDFLIKSHVYGLVAPHPLPKSPQLAVADLVQWSFARYGRRGLFGTAEDVTHLAVIRDQDGRCTLRL